MDRSEGTSGRPRPEASRLEKKAAEEVLDEVLPDGPKRFPGDHASMSDAEFAAKVAAHRKEMGI